LGVQNNAKLCEKCHTNVETYVSNNSDPVGAGIAAQFGEQETHPFNRFWELEKVELAYL